MFKPHRLFICIRGAPAMSTRRGRLRYAAFGLSLLTMICALSLAASAQPADIEAVIAELPKGFVGEFKWDDDGAIQNVAIRFKTVRRLDAEHAEALGCGNYNAGGTTTAIDVKMQVTLSGLRVEIWESAPDRASFVTDGSHRGSLSVDLREIDADWTTASTGQHGRLRLRAAPAAQCAPAEAT
jgi:hypothetical protein